MSKQRRMPKYLGGKIQAGSQFELDSRGRAIEKPK